MQKKFPLWATLCTIAGIGILCTLGTWQLHRLEWKESLLAELNTEYARNAANTILKPEDLHKEFQFRRGTLTGTYLYDKEIFIGPRTYEHIPGLNVLTPFRLDDGSMVLVNRGWLPQHWKITDEKSARTEGQIVSITGLLRKPAQGNSFSPDNNPAKDQWYMINMEQMAAARALPAFIPYVFYIENSDAAADYPLPEGERPDFSNNHLQYAIFWFSMAGILMVMYVLRFMRADKA